MELIEFKDLLEHNSDSQYGLLEDRNEPCVICLGCGGRLEFGDYEIVKKLPWQNLSKSIKQRDKYTYVVCMNEEYVRDAQYLDTRNLSQEEFDSFDYYNCENEELWRDMEPNPFIAIVEATSEDEACQKAAEQKQYDMRCLFAIKI